MTQEANMNRQHFEFEKSIHLNVSNETLAEKKLTVKWQVRNAKARILWSKEKEILVPPLSSVWLEKEELPDIHVFEEYVSYQAWEGEEKISEGTVIFSYPKYFRYEDPRLSCTVEDNRITVKAETYAKSVEILNDQEDLVLSDNYFDLNGGSKTVEILRGKPENLRLRSVWDIGQDPV